MNIAHHNELLARGRCGRCAEKVSPTALLREASCSHCQSMLTSAGRDILHQIKSRQMQWRLFGYALIAMGSFVAGAIPLLQIVVQVMALFILHIIVLRGGLNWLSTKRRILARISIKIFGAAIATTSLLINVAVIPMVGASAFILAVVGPLLTAAYIEGGLFILRKRLRWESEERPLQVREWGLPAALLFILFTAVTATVVLFATLVHLITSAEIPAIGFITSTPLELSP